MAQSDTSPLPPDRRQSLWVDPHFQGWFLLMTGGVSLITLGSLWLAKWLFIQQFARLATTLKLPSDHPYYGLLASQSEALSWIMASVGGVGLLATTIWGVILSHRIAGPILRLSRELDAMKASGKLHPVSHRTEDCFPELFQSFNQLAKAQNKENQTPSKKVA